MIPDEAVEAHRHLPVEVYSRPWWNWFRKTYQTLCWECDDVLLEGRLWTAND